MDGTDARARTAVEVAREAGALARRHFQDLAGLRIEEKGVQDFVTQADREVEDLIRNRLAEAFPEDGFLGEEHGRSGGSEGTWVVDPIDGTANFLRGVPWFGVSIAYVRERAEIGVVLDVAQDDLYRAVRGEGAFRNGTRLRISPQTRLERSAFCTGFWTRGDPKDFVEAVGRAVDAHLDVRRLGAACLGLAYVAAGAFEGFWQVQIHSWDVAAGIVLVEEAGGWVSPFFESGGLQGPRPLLAAAPGVAEALAQIVDLPPDHRPR